MEEKIVVQEAGFRVEVTTWENDGDNYNTHSVTYPLDTGWEFIEFLMGVLWDFRPSSELSNQYDLNDAYLGELASIFRNAYTKYPEVFKKYVEEEWLSDDYDEDDAVENLSMAMTDFLGDFGVANGDFAIRVVSHVRIIRHDEPVYAVLMLDERKW